MPKYKVTRYSELQEIEIDDSLDEAEESDLKERNWNKDVQ